MLEFVSNQYSFKNSKDQKKKILGMMVHEAGKLARNWESLWLAMMREIVCNGPRTSWRWWCWWSWWQLWSSPECSGSLLGKERQRARKIVTCTSVCHDLDYVDNGRICHVPIVILFCSSVNGTSKASLQRSGMADSLQLSEYRHLTELVAMFHVVSYTWVCYILFLHISSK